ncbi:beta-galactosidase [Hahella sp. CR1]|uniref:beta-galactosidase n=1 Tax=Hahella sp. CR1 TaxID=2992807 RepID=UPI002441B89F|nr:beta-galactosidase [Hahella sp. CR1]MDG9668964.1 beta-galactosidase [Hahella sp. CR1]
MYKEIFATRSHTFSSIRNNWKAAFNSLLISGAIVASGAVSSTANAMQSPNLSGIYCSCSPTTERNSSVFHNAGEIEYMDGVLVRISWALLEPTPGVYDWSRLDSQLAKAQQEGVKIALAITNGAEAPSWLKSEGAQTLDYLFRSVYPKSMPLPWDSVFLDRYSQFIDALGQRYDGNPNIALVHMTNSTTNGFEMQYFFDRDTENRFRSMGFSNEALVESWKQIMDAYDDAFPNTKLDVEIHPVFRSPVVAQEVAAYGHASIGQRFGLFAAWFSEENAMTAYPDMYNLLVSAQATSFAAVQIVGTASSDRANIQLTEEELLGSIQFALDSGFNYIEVWAADLKSDALSDDLTLVHTSIQLASE